MPDITVPGKKPTGDDLEWKRQVAEALRQIQIALRSLNTER